MAGGKETPRQKMIGMMYLVLTALLAMNISKDVLNAFIQINRGLVENSENSEERADATMGLLNAWSDATKAGPFREEATKVVDEADKLIAYIVELKARVLAASIHGNATGDGFEEFIDKDYQSKHGRPGIIDIGDKEKVSKPDENQNTTALLIGSEPANPKTGAWTATELREKLTAFSTRCLAIEVTDIKGNKHSINDDKEAPKAAKSLIENTFVFKDIDNADHEPEKWETALFYHTPLAAVISHLSKIESDVILVKNAALNYLTSEINASDLKFSDVTVAVVPKQSYVLRGDSFVAEIYLAAFNKDSKTRVYIGGEAGENATPALFDYSGITPIVSGSNGKCKFKTNEGAIGKHSYKGVIVYQDADGQDQPIPFVIPPFTVGEASVTVDLELLKVMFAGTANPVSITIPGVGADAITVSAVGASANKLGGGRFEFTPQSGQSKVTLNISAPVNGQNLSFTKDYKVKAMPIPGIYLCGKGNGETVSGGLLRSNPIIGAGYGPQGLLTPEAGFVCSLKSFFLQIDGGKAMQSSSGGLTPEMINALKSIKAGQKVIIYNGSATVKGTTSSGITATYLVN